MNPASTSRVLRRIAAIIESADSPSKDSVRRDVAHMRQALAGSESSYRYLVARFIRKSSDHDLLKQVDAAFIAKGVYPPFLKKVSSGYYCGEIGSGIELEIGIEGGRIDKVAVAGRLAKDLSEAPDIYSFLKARRAAEPPPPPPDLLAAPTATGIRTRSSVTDAAKRSTPRRRTSRAPSAGWSTRSAPGATATTT